MSARVFKPIPFADISKIKASSPISGNLIYKGSLANVRRSLFNPDPDETQRFLREEFTKIANNDRDRWDFDFVTGKPKDVYERYEWISVNETPNKHCPRPVKHSLSPPAFNNFLYAPIPSSSESTLDEESMEETMLVNTVRNQQKKQKLITDFMQAKKRKLETGFKKKLDHSTSRPTKLPRMSLTDITS